jgi:hypothetical protein
MGNVLSPAALAIYYTVGRWNKCALLRICPYLARGGASSHRNVDRYKEPRPRGASMSSNRRINPRHVAGILGLAFDAEDGHKRITRGKNFLLAGGSEETHGMMRETIVKVTDRLDERGLNLADVSVEQLRDLLDEAQSS